MLVLLGGRLRPTHDYRMELARFPSLPNRVGVGRARPGLPIEPSVPRAAPDRAGMNERLSECSLALRHGVLCQDIVSTPRT